MTVITSHNSKLIPIWQLNTEKMAESALLHVFKIAFPSSPLLLFWGMGVFLYSPCTTSNTLLSRNKSENLKTQKILKDSVGKRRAVGCGETMGARWGAGSVPSGGPPAHRSPAHRTLAHRSPCKDHLPTYHLVRITCPQITCKDHLPTDHLVNITYP